MSLSQALNQFAQNLGRYPESSGTARFTITSLWCVPVVMYVWER